MACHHVGQSNEDRLIYFGGSKLYNSDLYLTCNLSFVLRTKSNAEWSNSVSRYNYQGWYGMICFPMPKLSFFAYNKVRVIPKQTKQQVLGQSPPVESPLRHYITGQSPHRQCPPRALPDRHYPPSWCEEYIKTYSVILLHKLYCLTPIWQGDF